MMNATRATVRASEGAPEFRGQSRHWGILIPSLSDASLCSTCHPDTGQGTVVFGSCIGQFPGISFLRRGKHHVSPAVDYSNYP